MTHGSGASRTSSTHGSGQWRSVLDNKLSEKQFSPLHISVTETQMLTICELNLQVVFILSIKYTRWTYHDGCAHILIPCTASIRSTVFSVFGEKLRSHSQVSL